MLMWSTEMLIFEKEIGLDAVSITEKILEKL